MGVDPVTIEEKNFVATDGFKVFYRIGRPKKKKAALILLHGMNLHSGVYMPVIENCVREGILVLAADQRGRGRSVDRWGRKELPSIRRLVEDVKEMREGQAKAINGLPLFVGGISFGAMLGMMFARDLENEAVQGMVLAGPPFGMNAAAHLPKVRLAAELSPTKAIRKAAEPELLYETRECQERLRKDPLYSREPLRAATALEIICSLEDIEKNIGSMRMPLLVLYGGKDRIVKPRQLEVIRERWGCKDCRIVLMEGVGHEVINEIQVMESIRNGKVRATYVDWILDRVKPATAARSGGR